MQVSIGIFYTTITGRELDRDGRDRLAEMVHRPRMHLVLHGLDLLRHPCLARRRLVPAEDAPAARSRGRGLAGLRASLLLTGIVQELAWQ